MCNESPSDRRGEREIFFAALDRATAEERAAYLDGACGSELGLRHRVEALLAQHFEKDSFLMRPAIDEGATLALPAHPVEESGMVIGRYKLMQPLGEGGFGSVWAAEQREPVRRRVALKIVKLGMDTRQVVARFEAERQALALMDHPNIAKVLDAGASETGRPYFVMELVRGIPITQYCEQEELVTRERLELFIKVCHAVQHAHQKGIIHRDIKPSNVLVTLHDGVPMPKVIDFGIAKATQGELTDKTIFTQLQQFIGTPAYMSPEQAEMSGLDIDTRTDIYSLGVLLYELLTGSTPFDTTELMRSGVDEMRRIIREREPLRPSTRLTQLDHSAKWHGANRRSKIEKDLDWIVMKCLEKDRTRRYETANGLAEDLKRHVNDEPVTARPPSTAYRMQKAWHRHRTAFAAAVVVVIALVCGVAVSTWQTIATSRERDRALAAEIVAEQSRQAEREERLRAERGEAELQRLSLDLAFSRGMALCEEGKVREGMLWLARTLEIAPAGEKEFRRVVLENLAAWRLRVHPLRNQFEHPHQVVASAFSPDGLLVLTGCADGVARLWDAFTGDLVREFAGHLGLVHGVSFSPCGDRIATASWDHTAQLWDAHTGGRIGGPFDHEAGVYVARFSRNGSQLLTACGAGSAQVWDVATQVRTAVIPKHSQALHDAVFSLDEAHLLTACFDHHAYLWRVGETGEPVRQFRHADKVVAVGFTPDKVRVATAGEDHLVQLWNLETGEPSAPPLVHAGIPHALSFSPDGALLATAAFDNTARLWDAINGESLDPPFEHRAPVETVSFSPDNSLLLSGSYDGKAFIWELEPRARPSDPPLPHGDPVFKVAYSSDGSRILTACGDGKARLWDAHTRRLLCEYPHEASVRTAEFSQDGKRIVTGSVDTTAQVWSSVTGERIGVPMRHANSVDSVVFSSDGLYVLTGSMDGTVQLWNADSGELVGSPFVRLAHAINGVALSPDGSWVLAGAHDHLARLWDRATGKLLHTFRHRAGITRVAFHPESSLIATASYDNTVRLWDHVSGERRAHVLYHNGPVSGLSFSPDGGRALTTASRAARMWDVETGRPVGGAYVHSSVVADAAFSPDGQWIATAAADGMVRIWSVAADRLPDAPAAINLWVQVLTGIELDGDGKVQLLDQETWRQRIRDLRAHEDFKAQGDLARR
jgi:eukaryotic-like serine/threonine-protein kinase